MGKRFLSCMVFIAYEVIRVACLRRVIKPTARQTSHANDLVKPKSHAREKPLLAAVQILPPFMALESTKTIAP